MGFFINFLYILNYSIFFLLKTLIDIFVTDYQYFLKRFRVVYNISSNLYKNNFLINFSLKLIQSFVSVYIIFKCSIWAEREVYDMFGIKFFNNWDQRRILTDYTFFGFPLRKDFPLIGYKQIRYDDIQNRLIYEPVTLTQKYRYFTFSSP